MSSRHFLNPVGRLVQSFEKEPATSPVGFWQLKSGYFSSRILHQDTIMEMMGNRKGIPRFILDWELDSFEGDLSGRIRFSGDLNISEDLIFCDGSIGVSQINFIYNSKSKCTLLYGYLIGINLDIIELPVVGIQGEKLILFLKRDELSKYMEHPLEVKDDNFVCVLRIKDTAYLE